MESLYDNPENTYGYFNFLPNAFGASDGDDELVVIPPVDAYTDEDNFDDNSLNVESFPQEVAGTLEIMKKHYTEETFDSSDDQLLSA